MIRQYWLSVSIPHFRFNRALKLCSLILLALFADNLKQIDRLPSSLDFHCTQFFQRKRMLGLSRRLSIDQEMNSVLSG